MKHLLLRTDWYNLMEHQVLRDLEDAIVLKTKAEIVFPPQTQITKFFKKRLAHGTRYAPLRRFVPKRPFLCKADVLWVPLMGPEYFQLDLFTGWDTQANLKILYLFDTFPCQFSVIRQITKCCKWDLLITSFTDAVEPLNKFTQRKWHCVPQGVNLNRFYPRQWGTENLPPIFISSYGRRLAGYHEEIKKWCIAHKRWYDYTITDSHKISVSIQDSHQCFADHMGSSLFTVCWPVEMTDFQRAGGLSPITCRWFEAAASGATIIGRPPRDASFKHLFGKDAVYPLPEKAEDVFGWLDELEEYGPQLRDRALVRLSQYKDQWSWESRVQAILDLLG